MKFSNEVRRRLGQAARRVKANFKPRIFPNILRDKVYLQAQERAAEMKQINAAAPLAAEIVKQHTHEERAAITAATGISKAAAGEILEAADYLAERERRRRDNPILPDAQAYNIVKRRKERLSKRLIQAFKRAAPDMKSKRIKAIYAALMAADVRDLSAYWQALRTPTHINAASYGTKAGGIYRRTYNGGKQGASALIGKQPTAPHYPTNREKYNRASNALTTRLFMAAEILEVIERKPQAAE